MNSTPNNDRKTEIIKQQGEKIKQLTEKIYEIQLTGKIPPLGYQVRTKKSFKRFINNNIELKKYANKKYIKQLKAMAEKSKKLEQIISANNLDFKSVSLHKTNRNYIRIAMFLNVQELLNEITSCESDYYTLINGYKVKSRSLRYNTFVGNQTCVKCGLKGCFLALEKSLSDDNTNETEDGRGYHLNLYGLNELGQEILMTKDHILPKSKGGEDNLENLQTMCVKCNERKGDRIE